MLNSKAYANVCLTEREREREKEREREIDRLAESVIVSEKVGGREKIEKHFPCTIHHDFLLFSRRFFLSFHQYYRNRSDVRIKIEILYTHIRSGCPANTQISFVISTACLSNILVLKPISSVSL